MSPSPSLCGSFRQLAALQPRSRAEPSRAPRKSLGRRPGPCAAYLVPSEPQHRYRVAGLAPAWRVAPSRAHQARFEAGRQGARRPVEAGYMEARREGAAGPGRGPGCAGRSPRPPPQLAASESGTRCAPPRRLPAAFWRVAPLRSLGPQLFEGRERGPPAGETRPRPSSGLRRGRGRGSREGRRDADSYGGEGSTPPTECPHWLCPAGHVGAGPGPPCPGAGGLGAAAFLWWLQRLLGQGGGSPRPPAQRAEARTTPGPSVQDSRPQPAPFRPEAVFQAPPERLHLLPPRPQPRAAVCCAVGTGAPGVHGSTRAPRCSPRSELPEAPFPSGRGAPGLA